MQYQHPEREIVRAALNMGSGSTLQTSAVEKSMARFGSQAKSGRHCQHHRSEVARSRHTKNHPQESQSDTSGSMRNVFVAKRSAKMSQNSSGAISA
jgi:hypothetical protein